MTWLSQLFGMFRAFQVWLVIAPWEEALRIRLGKDAVLLKPGPHWRIPFVDRIFVQSTRLRPLFETGQTVATKDGKVLTVSFTVYYSIVDMLKLYHTVQQPESMLIGRCQGVIAKTVNSAASALLSPSLIEEVAAKTLNELNWGLGDIKVELTTFAYVRTIRLIDKEYRTTSSANDLELPRV